MSRLDFPEWCLFQTGRGDLIGETCERLSRLYGLPAGSLWQLVEARLDAAPDWLDHEQELAFDAWQEWKRSTGATEAKLGEWNLTAEDLEASEDKGAA